MNNPIDRRFMPGGMLPVDNLYGTAFTGEEDAHTFRITYYEGSEAVAFTGEIAGEFINPAGVTVPLSGSLDEDGRAIVTLDEHCYAVAGRFILTIWAGRKVIYCGVGQVMNSQTDTIDYPTSGIPDVAALIEQLQDILDGWPADYTQLQSDVSDLKTALSVKTTSFTATAGETNTSFKFLENTWYKIVLSGGNYCTLVATGATTQTLLSSVLPGTYYVQSLYANTNIYANSNGNMSVAITNVDTIGYKVSTKADQSEIEHSITLTQESALTFYADYALKHGHTYMVELIGSNFSANIRGGNGTTVVADLVTGANAGRMYFPVYEGADCLNLIVYISGAGTIKITDLDTAKSDEQRVFIDVNTVYQFIEAVKLSNIRKVTINMLPGTYNLIDGFGADYFTNMEDTMSGLVLGNDVVINGNPRALITAIYTGSNTNVNQYFSVFNAGACVYPYSVSGGFTLNGVNISAKNIRYCVHDENNQSTVPYHNVYKNCYMYLDNSENAAWNNYLIIGGGLGANGVIDIEGCVFESTAHGSRTAVVSYHNSAHANAKSFINFAGNFITPINSLFRLGYHGTSTSKSIALVHDNKWGGSPSYGAESESDTTDNFDLKLWNNVEIT